MRTEQRSAIRADADIPSTSAPCHQETFRAQTIPHAKPPVAHRWMGFRDGLFTERSAGAALEPVASETFGSGKLARREPSPARSIECWVEPARAAIRCERRLTQPRRMSWKHFFRRL